jgi:hypothetical protein
VYDQHGNAAEHMNLPMEPSELTSRGGYGWTEMKGSWFFFGTYEAHEDDCRWRAPSWHETKLMEVNSHSNYHLGFRCCMNVGGGVRPASRDAGASDASGERTVSRPAPRSEAHKEPAHGAAKPAVVAPAEDSGSGGPAAGDTSDARQEAASPTP